MRDHGLRVEAERTTDVAGIRFALPKTEDD